MSVDDKAASWRQIIASQSRREAVLVASTARTGIVGYASVGPAQSLAGRLLEVIGNTPFYAGGGREARLTCSVGWAPFPWLLGEPSAQTHEEVLTIADRALSLAKEAGRNRAVGSRPAASGGNSKFEAGGIGFDVEVLAGPL